jgi:glycosyltransferase involved in cell wall biosynthesis
MNSPKFSIVIPTYNREREVCRAVQSCLSQDFAGFEIVVADDASGDGTIAALERFHDPRLRVVRRPVNGGECPARNSGIDHSRGDWVVFLDSDDALKPGSLAVLDAAIAAGSGDVSRYGFMYDSDLGTFSPDPKPEDTVLDYEGWLRFQQATVVSNCFFCTRRSTFSVVRMPDSSVAPTEYHLDFARRFLTRLIPQIVATGHTDAGNRLTSGPPGPRAALRAKHDRESIERILRKHGEALRRHAPRVYELVWRVRVLSHLIRREQRAGFRAFLGYLGHTCPRFRGLAGMGIAAISPAAFLRLRRMRPRSF